MIYLLVENMVYLNRHRNPFELIGVIDSYENKND
jgi:hypothetical protein